MIGLSVAAELSRRGVGSVTLLERGLVGKESSAAAAGMLASQAETDSADDFFRFCRASARLYPEFASSLAASTGIDIELDTTGTLYLSLGEGDSRKLARRREWQEAAGLKVERLAREDVLSLEPSANPEVREALFFPEDWQVENRKLVAALAAFCISKGVSIIENSGAASLIFEGGRASGVRTAGAAHTGGVVILAAGAWTPMIESGPAVIPEVKPIKGEIVSFGTERGLVRHVMYSPRGYVVPRSNGRILAGATVEEVGFDKSPTSAAEESISSAAFDIVPRLKTLEIKERRAGLRPMARDGRPIIGWVPGARGLIVAAGHYRNGILLAPATAALVSDIIEEKHSEFAEAFAIKA